jgi:beta-lactam-binding protein with PASTA domain
MSDLPTQGPGLPGSSWLQSEAKRLAEFERLIAVRNARASMPQQPRYDLGPLPPGWSQKDGVVTMGVAGPGGAVAPGLREPFGSYGTEPEVDWFTQATGFDRSWGTPPKLGYDHYAWNAERAIYEPVHSQTSQRNPGNNFLEQQAFDLARDNVFLQPYLDDSGQWQFRYVSVLTPYPTTEKPYTFWKSVEEMRPQEPRDVPVDPELARLLEGKSGQEAMEIRKNWLNEKVSKMFSGDFAAAGTYKDPVTGQTLTSYGPGGMKPIREDYSFEAWIRDPTLGGKIPGGAHLGANWNQPLVEQYKEDRRRAGLADLPPPVFTGFAGVKEKRAQKKEEERQKREEVKEQNQQAVDEYMEQYWKEVMADNAKLHEGAAADELATAQHRLDELNEKHKKAGSSPNEKEKKDLEAKVAEAGKKLKNAQEFAGEKQQELDAYEAGVPEAKKAGGSALPKTSEAAASEERELVPSVVGKWVSQATTTLRTAGFAAVEALSNETGTEGKVASQYPSAGSLLEKGQDVTIYVHSARKQTNVPPVVDLNSTKAYNEIVKAGLHPQKVTRPASRPGFVVEQWPAAGTQVLRGSTVRYTVGIKQTGTALGGGVFGILPKGSKMGSGAKLTGPFGVFEGGGPPSQWVNMQPDEDEGEGPARARGRPQGSTDGAPRAKQVEIPNLVGLTLDQAMKAKTSCPVVVKGGGVGLNYKTYTVGAQEPAAGERVYEAGCSITVTPLAPGAAPPAGASGAGGPSAGPSARPGGSMASKDPEGSYARVPDLGDLTLAEARAAAGRGRFVIEAEGPRDGRVTSQSPAARELATTGSVIRVTLKAPLKRPDKPPPKPPAKERPVERQTVTVVKGNWVTVPDVLKKERYEAEKEILKAGLRPEVRESYGTRSTHVLEQIPKGGEEAYGGTAVRITLGPLRAVADGIGDVPHIPRGILASETPGVRVPELFGRTDLEARELLREAGLVPPPEPTISIVDMSGWMVTEQHPPANELVPRGSTVNFTLSPRDYVTARPSKPPAPTVPEDEQVPVDGKVRVPDLVGKTVDDARNIIEPLELRLMLNNWARGGVVVEQEPQPKQQLSQGSSVYVSVQSPVPNVLGMTESDAQDELKDWGFTSNVWKRIRPMYGPSMVMEQIPSPGTLQAPGAYVSLAVGHPCDDRILEHISEPDSQAISALYSHAMDMTWDELRFPGGLAALLPEKADDATMRRAISEALENRCSLLGASRVERDGANAPLCVQLDALYKNRDARARYEEMFALGVRVHDSHGLSPTYGLPARPATEEELSWSLPELAARLTEYCSVPNWELDTCGRAGAKALVIALRLGQLKDGLEGRARWAKANGPLWARHRQWGAYMERKDESDVDPTLDSWFVTSVVPHTQQLIDFCQRQLDSLPTSGQDGCARALRMLLQVDMTLDCVSTVLAAFDVSRNLVEITGKAFETDTLREVMLSISWQADAKLKYVMDLALQSGLDPGAAVQALRAVTAPLPGFFAKYGVTEARVRAIDDFGTEVVLWTLGLKAASYVVKGAFWLAAGATRASLAEAVHLTYRLTARGVRAGEIALGENMAKGTWSLARTASRFDRLISGTVSAFGRGKQFRFPAAVSIPPEAARQMLTVPGVGPVTILKKLAGVRWMPPGWKLDLGIGRWVPSGTTSFGQKAWVYMTDGPGTYMLVDLALDSALAGGGYMLYQVLKDE